MSAIATIIILEIVVHLLKTIDYDPDGSQMFLERRRLIKWARIAIILEIILAIMEMISAALDMLTSFAT